MGQVNACGQRSTRRAAILNVLPTSCSQVRTRCSKTTWLASVA